MSRLDPAKMACWKAASLGMKFVEGEGGWPLFGDTYHVLNSEQCWCGPKSWVACPECGDGAEHPCWRCSQYVDGDERGSVAPASGGLVPYDGSDPDATVIVIHRGVRHPAEMDQGAAPMKPPPVLGTESEEASS